MFYSIYKYDNLGKSTKYDSISISGIQYGKTADWLRDSIVFYPDPKPRTRNSQNEVKKRITVKYPLTQKIKELRLTNADATKFSMKYYKNESYKRSTRIDTAGYRSIEKFDRKGNCIEQSIYKPNGTLVVKRVIEPEKKGISTIKTYTGKLLTDISINKSICDKAGNVIIDSIFENNRLLQIIKHEYDYYD